MNSAKAMAAESSYSFPRPKRGLAWIVNNKIKKPEANILTLKVLFAKLKFETKTFSFDEMPGFIDEMKILNFSNYNIFFLVVLSDEQDGFKCSMFESDRNPILITECCESVAKNLTMIGCPKILIFESRLASGEREETISLKRLQGSAKFFNDVVLVNVISKTSKGPAFIVALCQLVEDGCDKVDFENILKQLNAKFLGRMISLSTLRKKLFLRRGKTLI